MRGSSDGSTSLVRVMCGGKHGSCIFGKTLGSVVAESMELGFDRGQEPDGSCRSIQHCSSVRMDLKDVPMDNISYFPEE